MGLPYTTISILFGYRGNVYSPRGANIDKLPAWPIMVVWKSKCQMTILASVWITMHSTFVILLIKSVRLEYSPNDYMICNGCLFKVFIRRVCRQFIKLTLHTWAVVGPKWYIRTIPDSKVHGTNMGPTWVLSSPDRPHVGPMNLAIRDVSSMSGRALVSKMFRSEINGVTSDQWIPLTKASDAELWCFIWSAPE